MLHRAATTAYSWWWASHIRTKQSKWLEQNLQDMEEKVKFMLKIIEQEGDSFAKRAEMYYKKRPELISYVEESYRAYRALAERFDHISKDLQSANRTIATVFPEQVQLALESDDDDSSIGSTAPSPDRVSTRSSLSVPKNLPKAPKLPKQSLKAKREQLRRNVTSSHGTSSGLNKDEANKEIDALQKDILTWQTEKEFMKSAYESALAKFLELESKITDSQSRVCVLQDEFGVGTIMEDHEARALMAGSALKSCSEALAKLQEEQNRSFEEVKQEYERIKEGHERLAKLKKLGEKDDGSQQGLSDGPVAFGEALIDIEPEEGEDVEAFRERIREQLKMSSDSVFTEPEMADKIDDLVEKVVHLETVVCSYNALVKRLRQEIDAILAHIKTLEEQKQPILEGSAMSFRLRELEEELIRVNSLNKQVIEQKKCINEQITEAGCNVDHLKEKMHNVKLAEDGEYFGFFKETKGEQDVEAQKEEIERDTEKEKLPHPPEPQQETKVEEEDEEEKQDAPRSAENIIDIADLQVEEEDGLNWRRLYLNNMEDREKILIEEYTMIFRDYKDVKSKLSEMEKKHRDQIFEMASHVRELRNIITAKDEEIQMLLKRISDLESKGDKNTDSVPKNSKQEQNDGETKDPASTIDNDVDKDIIATKDVEIQMLRKKLLTLQGHRSVYSDTWVLKEHNDLKQEDKDDSKKNNAVMSRSASDRKPLFHHLYDQDAFIKEVTNAGDKEGSGRGAKTDFITQSTPISGAKARFRVELDNLLEANLDFWLRFSSSVHQIQKLQTSLRDLQAELTKLKQSERKEDKSQQLVKSDVRPLYKHLREKHTELTLWLEHSVVFQEELNSRFSSLNKIQDEIRKVSSGKEEDNELTSYQAAKFHGEILNMKQENSKVAEELQAGVHRAKALKEDVGKLLAKLDKEFGFSEANIRHSSSFKNPFNKPRIPLHSFLFGVRLRRHRHRPSILACVTPALPSRPDDDDDSVG
ncbi:hypothetical protein Cgig2_004739 [Carnegiea gigantea]|uniref:NAB domain-containing protein n=1 Tax=Carnegiea gigantea TaxID=171969 RepID=A0A9Q1QPZ2_9CARY|nr:hypothetical protein Cgig2_004739 [Carnegiea gigantea]